MHIPILNEVVKCAGVYMRGRFTYFAVLFMVASVVPGLSAAVCSDTTDCTFTFNVDNTGSDLQTLSNYGTVELQVVGSDIKFTIDLLSNFHLIAIGNRPGVLGFNDTLSGALTYSGFSDSNYSGGNGGGASDPYDFFGSFTAAAGTTTAPGPGAAQPSVNSLSFTVSRTGGFTDVNQLVDLSTNPPGSMQAYFAADIFQSSGSCIGSCTGLIGVTGGPNPPSVPEPAYLGLLAGFGVVAFLVQRRRKNSVLAE